CPPAPLCPACETWFHWRNKQHRKRPFGRTKKKPKRIRGCDRAQGSLRLRWRLPCPSHRKQGRNPDCFEGGRRASPRRGSSNWTLPVLLYGLGPETCLFDGIPQLPLVHLTVVIRNRGEPLLGADIGTLDAFRLLQAPLHTYGACTAGHARNLDRSGSFLRHRGTREQQQNCEQS